MSNKMASVHSCPGRLAKLAPPPPPPDVVQADVADVHIQEKQVLYELNLIYKKLLNFEH